MKTLTLKSAGRKKLVLLLAFLICTFNAVNGQLYLQLVPSDYNGTNISCFGAKDG